MAKAADVKKTTEVKTEKKTMPNAKAVEAKVEAKAAELKDAVKKTAEKAVAEKTEPVKKAVAEKTEPVKKAVAEKKNAVEKKVATAKKVAKKELVEQVYLQFTDNETKVDDVIIRVKAAYEAEGHKASSIKSLRVYLKPEENAAYYVINDKSAGRVDLF